MREEHRNAGCPANTTFEVGMHCLWVCGYSVAGVTLVTVFQEIVFQ